MNAAPRAGESVAAALHWATERLAQTGADAPALDAELILAHLLKSDRSAILSHPERRLTSAQASALAALVGRRAGREPLAYILGHKEFYGFDVDVAGPVLIPRPETEELVERALAWLRRRALPAPLIADVGTGSGAIAIALASHAPAARLYALEVSTEARVVAGRNIARHGLSERVTLLAGDLLGTLPDAVDLIVANLPYIPTDDLATLMPEVGRHEPRLALDGGADGLSVIRRLLEQAPARLRAGGAVMLEIGAGQGPPARAAAQLAFPQAAIDVHLDLAGHDRIVTIQLSDEARPCATA